MSNWNLHQKEVPYEMSFSFLAKGSPKNHLRDSVENTLIFASINHNLTIGESVSCMKDPLVS